MLVRANQQVTSSWFTGILEGEGCFEKSKKQNIRVRISNTNLDIIEACECFLKMNNVYFVTHVHKRSGRKTEYEISIRTSRELTLNYPHILFKLVEENLQCRYSEFARILGTSETVRDLSVDLDWLIGVYEAEGSFSIVMNNRGNVAYKIDLSSTNPRILEKVALNLRAMDCSWHVENKTSYQLHHKAAQAINIYGMKRCSRFLKATLNKWVAERNQLRTSLMLELAESRFSKPIKSKYSDRELSIIQEMKVLNLKG